VEHLLPLFIKFRDFLVSIAPWLILGLVAAAGLREYLRRSWPARKVRAPSPGLITLAGLSLAAPTIFTIFMLDYRLAVLTAVLATAFVYAGARLLVPAADRHAALEKLNWLPSGDTPDTGEDYRSGQTAWRQAVDLWNGIWDRFDDVAVWFMGACLVAAVLAIYLPFEAGQGLFGRTPWFAVVLAAAVGRMLPVGKSTELPLVLLLLLKGAFPGAVAALVLAAAPVPFVHRKTSLDRRQWIFLLVQFAGAAILGGALGPALL
jgi:uncharacterized membrane protein YraQ (UPF0718 family)